MRRCLLVCGLQQAKRKGIERKFDKIVDWCNAHYDEYDFSIHVVRVNKTNNKSFDLMRGKDIIVEDEDARLCFNAMTKLIESEGYCISEWEDMPKDVTYDIVGVSTSAAVLAIAYQMFSMGYHIRILTDYCADRKGLEKEAEKIIKAYMPNALV